MNDSQTAFFLNSAFVPLKKWLEQSPNNYNIALVSGLALLIVVIFSMFFLQKVIGKTDERTGILYARSCAGMLIAVILCDLIFPKDYMWQIFFVYKYDIVFLVGVVYLSIQYNKEK